jgi:hypothetical protein
MKKLLLLPLLISGCTTATYTVTTPTETRTFTIVRPSIYDTHLGELEVETPDGVKVHLKDMDSKEKGTQILEKMIDKIPNATVVP